MNDTPRTIDVTPTWSGLVHAFVALIENGTAEGRATAISEIRRMAAIADEAVAAQKAEAAAPTQEVYGVFDLTANTFTAFFEDSGIATKFAATGPNLRVYPKTLPAKFFARAANVEGN
jgi:hypothetical protein